MASCTSENWTLRDLSLALRNMHKDNKTIVVPMFQRGKRWKPYQEEAFIDSLTKSYPIGTMLFYRSVDGQKEIYTLVDGLQRGNTIKKYMAAPTQYFTSSVIPTNIVESIFEILGLAGQVNIIKAGIANVFVEQIRSLDTLSGVQYYPIAKAIVDIYPTTNPLAIGEIIETIEPFLKDFHDKYEKIANTVIPVIVYSGDEDSLPEIFDRINSKGTPLNTYEVYAAAWPVNRKFKVNNSEIVDRVMKKYDTLADDDFNVIGYNRDEMRINRNLNAFEYVFGLSRYLNDKYDFLRFDNNSADDEINPMGFELINACINDSKDTIKTLYNDILSLDINAFEKRLVEVVEFVGRIIAKVTLFKGNNRSNKTILHSKYQIMSMISTTFKEKYEISDLSKSKLTWETNRAMLEKTMIQRYVYDIIRNEWSDGGTSKLHKVAKPNKYLIPVPRKVWESTLNEYFEQNNMRQESKNVANPRKEDIVLLNCIYLPLFTALDQLSLAKFDIEHIATKDQMKGLIAKCRSNGLPISSIANLCFLPEKINRIKGSKTFYQDINYLRHINITEIEKKYSFTKEEDLEWMDLPYNSSDATVLKEYYMAFLNKRFKKQKEMFYKSLDIENENNDFNEGINEEDLGDEQNNHTSGVDYSTREKYIDLRNDCISLISSKFENNFEKTSEGVYVSDDGLMGVVICVSKKYIQGEKEKYWFAYRTVYADRLNSYEKKYIAFGCESKENTLLFPLEVIESNKHKLRYTEKEGKVHWHIVFFKNNDNRIVWQHSIPTVTEIELTQYKL